MTYSAQYNDFLLNKQFFFSQVPAGMSDVAALAKQRDYAFLHKNRTIIEQEAEQLFAVLSEESLHQDKRYQQEFWFYCYYCCLMLQEFYRIYDDINKLSAYEQLAQDALFSTNNCN